MRFHGDGPSLPDELIIAREQGRVVFFCGAGVSLARAVLPDFLCLAKTVVRELGALPNSGALKLLNRIQELKSDFDLPAAYSVDQVFGLLEREFVRRDIQKGVARALRPNDGVDLTAHRALLDLATTKEGEIRLVTTNFDLLFEDCRSELICWQSPKFPDPNRPGDMDGIVYLHGRVTSDYLGASGDGFILSTSEFGQAYLAQGWATRFVRDILQKYVVVFVGYSADDPPMRYLLEGLQSRSTSKNPIYAFHHGDQNSATASWAHKGVTPIIYDEHESLWDTLDAWSDMAKDPDAWYQSRLDMAAEGPEELKPHERGQIAHLFSTAGGLRRVLKHSKGLPASWLYVLDPTFRFSEPQKTYTGDSFEATDDPFDLYGLDSDPAPEPVNLQDYRAQRTVPDDAWNAFTISQRDRLDIDDRHLSRLFDRHPLYSPQMPERLQLIAQWIGRSASDSDALWWASQKQVLHSIAVERLESHLARSEELVPTWLVGNWRLLFECWSAAPKKFGHDYYTLEQQMGKHGWNSSFLRTYLSLLEPYLICSNANTRPNAVKWSGFSVEGRLSFDVSYPRIDEIEVPSDWLEPVVKGVGRLLEHAVALEHHCGGYRLELQDPITRITPQPGYRHAPAERLGGHVKFFVKLFEQLVDHDLAAAQREFERWPLNEDPLFTQLKVWACGLQGVISDDTAFEIFVGLDDEQFWHFALGPDLMVALSRRWNNLLDVQPRVEDRILAGPKTPDDENDPDFKLRAAYSILDRVHVLQQNGCAFSVGSVAFVRGLKALATQWDGDSAERRVYQPRMRGGFVRQQKDYQDLMSVPVAEIVSRAKELSGRTGDFLVEADPFLGLCAERPVKALAALRLANVRDDFYHRAWEKFLNTVKGENTQPRLCALVALRIADHPDDFVKKHIHAVASWFSQTSKNWASTYTKPHSLLLDRLVTLLSHEDCDAKSGVVRQEGRNIDWVMEAINSASGMIAEVLFSNALLDQMSPETRLLDKWKGHATGLLSLNGDSANYALVVSSMRLSWLFYIDPQWTEQNVLHCLTSEDACDSDPLWAGFLRDRNAPFFSLALRLKPDLLTLAKSGRSVTRDDTRLLAAKLVSCWLSRNETNNDERLVSNSQLREVLVEVKEDFRSHVLWLISDWTADANLEAGSDDEARRFIRDVWPRQKAVRTPKISAQLLEFAFAEERRFLAISELILPLLTSMDTTETTLFSIHKDKNGIIRNHPERVLALLYAAFPDDPTTWPYFSGETLNLISEADPSLQQDPRLIELKRRWDSR